MTHLRFKILTTIALIENGVVSPETRMPSPVSTTLPGTATEVIGMGEHPANAVRVKKDSSIVEGCRLVKEGRADGVFSAGSTGACLAEATIAADLILGLVQGQVVQAGNHVQTWHGQRLTGCRGQVRG